jgi:hypothetical protein
VAGVNEGYVNLGDKGAQFETEILLGSLRIYILVFARAKRFACGTEMRMMFPQRSLQPGSAIRAVRI